MILHKTGHSIADTISDRIGELPDFDCRIGYGILRGTAEYLRAHDNWFEIDKGMWDAGHFDGQYRISFRGTQPRWSAELSKTHNQVMQPWRRSGKYTLICPPTDSVCQFFGIDLPLWLKKSMYVAAQFGDYQFRTKGIQEEINWDDVKMLITFNSSLGIEAIKRGIPTMSDPKHSTIGSYCNTIKAIDGYDRDELFSFISAHHFKLDDREHICRVISHYLSSSGMTAGKL